MRTLLLALVLIGCPKAAPNNAVDWAATPQLPSPTAGTYARVRVEPRDPGVAHVLGARKPDASLAGTAAGLALALVTDRGGLSPQEVREAAWRAGWPYPVRSVHTVWTDAEAPPPQAVIDLVAAVPDEAEVGLVRARSSLRDLWLLVTAVPRVDLGPLPRQLPVGADLALPKVPGARFSVADPLGRLIEGHLDLGWSTPASVEGEWMVEVRDDVGRLALFPVYVGMTPPDLGLLPAGEAPEDAATAVARAATLLAEVRDAYGLPAPEADPLLQNALPWVMDDPSLSSERIARRVGIEPGGLWLLTCRGPTVETCLDDIVWDPGARPALLAEALIAAIGARVGSNGVDLTLILARQ